MKTKKTKKSVKMRGTNNYGRGDRKKGKGSGHRGGKGNAGTGKRADHKKSLVQKLHGKKYFGKQGATSRRTAKDTAKVINLHDIQQNYESLMKKFGEKNELFLKNYKVLGTGELTTKVTVKALSFSKVAEEKIKKAGGNALLQNPKKEKEEEPKKQPEKKPNSA